MKTVSRTLAMLLALAAAGGPLQAQDEEAKKKPEHTDYRSFTAKNGKSLEARVVTRLDDKRYTVETKDGKSYTLDIDNLSASDAQFLEFWEPGAIVDLAKASLDVVLKKMNYSMADLTTTGDKQIFPATVDGTEITFVLAPGRNFSALDPAVAAKLGLELGQGRINVRDAQGNQARTKQGTVKSFVIGNVEIESFAFQVFEIGKIEGTAPASTGGVAGSDLLEKLNAVIDLGGKQLFVKTSDE